MTFTNLGSKIFPNGRIAQSKQISPKENTGEPHLDNPSNPNPEEVVIGQNLVTGEPLVLKTGGEPEGWVHYSSPQALANKLGISYDEYQTLSFAEIQKFVEDYNNKNPRIKIAFP